MIRILAGTLRSRQILTPRGSSTRPTSAQIRQAVFNMCQDSIMGASFLDLCAGSGAMGFEALSRGARSCCFVEHDRQALFAIKENSKRFEVEDRCNIHFGDCLCAFKKLEGPFDICYFDPPYSTKKGQTSELVVSVLSELDKAAFLADNGTVFVEESIYADLSALTFKRLVLQDRRKYGSSQLYCFCIPSVS